MTYCGKCGAKYPKFSKVLNAMETEVYASQSQSLQTTKQKPTRWHMGHRFNWCSDIWACDRQTIQSPRN